jgi:uroporphyrinogen decarboxylase
VFIKAYEEVKLSLMEPREIVKRAIEFRCPPRLPVNGYGENSDCIWIPTEDILPQQVPSIPGLDQWSCRWEKTDLPNMGQVKGHPLRSLADLDAFPWPDVNDPRRYARVNDRLDAVDADPKLRGQYRICSIFMLLWERMQALHGLENCMLDMMEDKPAIHELADRLVAYNIGFIENMHRVAGNRIDCFNFSEDWGTQLDLMVSPRLFRRFFFPRYQRIFTAAHEAGWHVWMHSCGKINKSIPILIEAGVDVLNMQQPLTNGILEIGKEFAGKVCFETLCDIQRTLPKGDPDDIKNQAVELMRRWGIAEGGFVLGDYGDEGAIGTAPETKEYMLSVFRQHDPWKNGSW